MFNSERTQAIRIGVWFETAPGADLAYEGLTRLLFLLIENDASHSLELVLVVAPWAAAQMSAAITELPAEVRGRVTIVTPSHRLPFLIRVFGLATRCVKPATAKRAFAVARVVTTSPHINLLTAAATALRSRIDLIFRRRLGGYYSDLIDRVSMNGGVGCWFILNLPTTFAQLPSGQPSVALLADYAYADFPGMVPAITERAFFHNCHRILHQAASVITMSSHVAERHAKEIFGVDASKITVIKSVGFRSVGEAFRGNRIDGEKSAARQVLRDAMGHATAWRTGRFFAEDCSPEYIFLPSQVRTYKNIPNVIRSLGLLAQAGTQLTLVTTGQISDELRGLAVANGLKPDSIVTVGRVSFRVLLALYMCAGVVVHVSRFEGGVGAFPLFEAVAARAPAICGRNLATLEYCADPAYRMTLVELDDARELAARITEALTRRDEVIERQERFTSLADEGTWEDVSGYYINVMRVAMRQFSQGLTPAHVAQSRTGVE